MDFRLIIRFILVILPLTFVFAACGGSGSDAIEPITVTPPETSSTTGNSPPNVEAGQTQNVTERQVVTLNAVATDTDGTISSYLWAQISGQPVETSDPTVSQLTFTAPTILGGGSQQVLEFEVTVTDNDGAVDTDSVAISIFHTQLGIRINAGPDRSVERSTEDILLSVSLSNAVESNVRFFWEQISGTEVDISLPNGAIANFRAPDLDQTDNPLSLRFRVTATGADDISVTDEITITVQPVSQLTECTLIINPGTSFVDSFAQLSDGEILCLNDGLYLQHMNVPSNLHVRAVNDGMAEIDGESSLGEDWTGGLFQMQGTNSSARGLKVHHAGENADACNVAGNNNIMRVMSCSHGGQHKHKIPLKISGSGHLIEDSWFFGEGRHITQAFYASNIIFRRIVARPGLAARAGQSEPRTGNVLYSTNDSIVESSIVFDGATQSVTPFYKSFSVAAHDVDGNINAPSNNQWYGNFVINMPDGQDGSFGASGIGVDPDSNVGGYNGIIKDFVIRGASVGVQIIGGAEQYSVDNCEIVDVVGFEVSIGSIPNPTTSVVNCGGSNQIREYPRYKNGVKSESEALFPFPYESLIKRDMCNQNERQSDWCLTDKTLSEYVQGL